MQILHLYAVVQVLLRHVPNEVGRRLPSSSRFGIKALEVSFAMASGLGTLLITSQSFTFTKKPHAPARGICGCIGLHQRPAQRVPHDYATIGCARQGILQGNMVLYGPHIPGM